MTPPTATTGMKIPHETANRLASVFLGNSTWRLPGRMPRVTIQGGSYGSWRTEYGERDLPLSRPLGACRSSAGKRSESPLFQSGSRLAQILMMKFKACHGCMMLCAAPPPVLPIVVETAGPCALVLVTEL